MEIAVDANEAAAAPGGLCNMALGVLHKYNAAQGFTLDRSSESGGRLYTDHNSENGQGLSLADRILLFLVGLQRSRIKEIELPDGAKLLDVEWDTDSDRPKLRELREPQLVNMQLSSLRFDTSAQTWRYTCACVGGSLPIGWFESGGSAFIAPMRFVMDSFVTSGMKELRQTLQKQLASQCASRPAPLQADFDVAALLT